MADLGFSFPSKFWCPRIGVLTYMFLTSFNCGSSVDRDSDNYCNWDAENRHGWGSHLCTEVGALVFSKWCDTKFWLLLVYELSGLKFHDLFSLLIQWSRWQIQPKTCVSKVCTYSLLIDLDYSILWMFWSKIFTFWFTYYDQGVSFNCYFPHFPNRTPDEVLAAKGVKPTLSPNLNTLALVEVCLTKLISICICTSICMLRLMHL